MPFPTHSAPARMMLAALLPAVLAAISMVVPATGEAPTGPAEPVVSASHAKPHAKPHTKPHAKPHAKPQAKSSASSGAPKARPAPRKQAPERRSGTTSRADRERIRSANRLLGTGLAQTTLRAARNAGIPLYIAVAFLQQETGGGRNVFGHDPTIFAGAGKVTKAKYLRYKALRERTGLMQGVGPMQLTWYAYQDWADRLGGAWKPYVNMLVGFRHLADLHRGLGSWHAAARAYNGTGPMAQAYANEMSHRFEVVRRGLA